ncbi:MAG: hypothetical protein M9894_16625 [Planctomycetes bacterium]|nr:hypothetical protein [Planctomycetota bacterium]
MWLPADSAEQIEQAVVAAEAHTAAELVVVGRPFSGTYRDVEYLFGVACALAFLGWALFAERMVPVESVVPTLVLCWLAGGLVCRYSPGLRRLMTPVERRRRQARDAARLAFLERGVDGTSGRTGVLVHVSFLERQVDLVADRAVREALGDEALARLGDELARALRGPAPIPSFCEGLVALGRTLGELLPRSEDDVDELCNVPVLHGGAG